MIGQLALDRAKAARPASNPLRELNLDFLNESGTITFGNL